MRRCRPLASRSATTGRLRRQSLITNGAGSSRRFCADPQSDPGVDSRPAAEDLIVEDGPGVGVLVSKQARQCGFGPAPGFVLAAAGSPQPDHAQRRFRRRSATRRSGLATLRHRLVNPDRDAPRRRGGPDGRGVGNTVAIFADARPRCAS